MGGGKRWAQQEYNLLREMMEADMTVEDIVKSGKFPGRTARAINHQIKRLGSFGTQKKKLFGTKIDSVDIISLEEVLKRFSDAVQQVCEAQELSKLELGRFRIIFAATTHTDLFQDLKPSVHIHKRFGKEIKVSYFPNEINRECSLVKEMRIEEGTKEDYEKLASFHYRDSRLFAHQKIFVLKRGEETAGVIVYGSPPIAVSGRRKAFGRNLSIQEINRDLTRISRVVVHPKYRTIGLGVKLVKETLPLAGKPYVETVAVMAKYNCFFERAGMLKIAESVPSKHVLNAIEKLRSLGFNPVLLSSEKANMRTLEEMSKKEVEEVKVVLKALCGRERGYGRRLLKTRSVFPKPEETRKVIDVAGLEKIAKTLRVLSFLAQTKVYLFWKTFQLARKYGCSKLGRLISFGTLWYQLAMRFDSTSEPPRTGNISNGGETIQSRLR